MRPPARRPARRAALTAAEIPTYTGPRPSAPTASSLRFLQAPGLLPRGRRLYVIGDIHGQAEKLKALHKQIAADLTNRPTASFAIIHLGDYLNQGPDSAGVINHLLTTRNTINLLGDHERMLLDAIEGDRAAATDWLWAGGKQALPSWGLDPDLPRQAWAGAFPASHITWLKTLKLTHHEGNYLFVHAGIRPEISVQDQTRDDLTTIRQPFLSSEADHGLIIVHGHSSVPSVPINPNRIGLDTGAGMGGKLTCAVLEDDVIALLAA